MFIIICANTPNERSNNLGIMNRIKIVKRIGYLLLSLSILTGCKEVKREEALAAINEIQCVETGIEFSLNGLWEIEDQNKTENGRTIELSAKNKETDAHILVLYEDISVKEGGNIIRTQDYLNNIIENLKVSEEYGFSIKEQQEITLFDKSFISFKARSEVMDAKQQYFINNNSEIITVMVITCYGEDEIADILLLGRGIN